MASEPIRILVAKPGLDGHDRGAKIIARVMRNHGFEVVYSGLHQTIEDIAAVARDEDVSVVGLSILSGAHIPFTRELREILDSWGMDDVKIIVGGIVPQSDIEELTNIGAAAVFPPNSDVLTIPDRIREVLELERPSEVVDA